MRSTQPPRPNNASALAANVDEGSASARGPLGSGPSPAGLVLAILAVLAVRARRGSVLATPDDSLPCPRKQLGFALLIVSQLESAVASMAPSGA